MDESIQKFLEEYNQLVPDMQQATIWILNNIQFVKGLCRGDPIPEGQYEECMNAAIKKKDYLLVALLIFKKKMDEHPA